MKPTRSKPPAKLHRKEKIKKVSSFTTDPVKVYCRLRPAEHPNEVSCINILSATVVQLSTPDSAANYRPGTYKEIQYTFQQAFSESTSQTEIFENVALPLVDDLIHGRNGLLFTYGVTGSGKTYTMIGDAKDGGILPRCLDVLFNSLNGVQAEKFILKPDRMNGFDVQSESDAVMDRQSELLAFAAASKSAKNTPYKSASKKNISDVIQRTPDATKIPDVDSDNTYSVFVTYVEIYNNSVYDLLEDMNEEASRTRSLQTKIIREDADRMMYVHGVTEVECKSANEAFKIFYAGQKKKRMAQTILNVESSRSHSVFTIRLVSAPLDSRGENVLQDKRAVTVSQLSLVDLAGSERTNRTNNVGQRLREAGNINNSLMTLRSCLEILRENQKLGGNKMVPYRDSRITHLFKGYFDGEGQIRMVVCVNPRSDDFDETVQVMKFAEITQEVQVARPTAKKPDLELMPGRRKANQMFKAAMETLEKKGVDLTGVQVDIGLVYTLGGPFPPLDVTTAEDEHVIQQLVEYLQMRIGRRCQLRNDTAAKIAAFRVHLVDVERDCVHLKQENACLNATLDHTRQRLEIFETKLVSTELQLNNALRDNTALLSENTVLGQQLKERDTELRQKEIEIERIKIKYSDRFEAKKERLTRQTERERKNQEAEYAEKRKADVDRLQLIRQIADENVKPPRSAVASHVSRFEANRRANLQELPAPSPRVQSARKIGVAVSNPRYRRSRSVGCEKWIDHRPAMTAPLGTVLQPSMPHSKSVRRLEMGDAVNSSKYCLTTQEIDTDGELETRLYKADVVPTAGGGAQVVFNDVELLRQESPTAPRKRRSQPTEAPADTKEKCATGIEGHARSKRTRKT